MPTVFPELFIAWERIFSQKLICQKHQSLERLATAGNADLLEGASDIVVQRIVVQPINIDDLGPM